MFFKDEQPENAQEPILVTPFSIVTDFIFVPYDECQGAEDEIDQFFIFPVPPIVNV